MSTSPYGSDKFSTLAQFCSDLHGTKTRTAYGPTLLAEARTYISNHNICALSLLLDNNEIDINQPIDNKNNKLLHLACKLNNLDVIKCLLDHGANPDMANDAGETALKMYN